MYIVSKRILGHLDGAAKTSIGASEACELLYTKYHITNIYTDSDNFDKYIIYS